MIRSSKHTLKFTNKHKLETLNVFIVQYREMVNKYINIIWNTYKDKIPQLLDNDVCKLIATEVEHDSRIRQCAAKQACSMVRAVLDKQHKRLYKLSQLQREGKNTLCLQRKIDLFRTQKPNANKIKVELDSRFVHIQEGNYFDLFVRVWQIGDKREIKIPIKHTQVSRRWNNEGQILSSIHLSNTTLTLYFEVNDRKTQGTKILGADQGLITCLTLSDGQTTKHDKDGWDLNKIIQKISRKQKGSKGFKRAQEHRKNYINWSINQLNFDGVKTLKLEKISNIRKGKNNSRRLSHWTYTLIKDKLVRLSEVKGFDFTEQDNKFRSQRCSQCGWTHSSNRKGKTFKCTNTNCGTTTDSDLNAASNHEIELVELDSQVWQKRLNHKGFYWLHDKIVFGQEPIVPDVQNLLQYN